MSSALHEVKRLFDALSPEDRETFLQSIQDELAGPSRPDVDAAWHAEALRRLADIRSGKTTPLDADEVMEEMLRIAK